MKWKHQVRALKPYQDKVYEIAELMNMLYDLSHAADLDRCRAVQVRLNLTDRLVNLEPVRHENRMVTTCPDCGQICPPRTDGTGVVCDECDRVCILEDRDVIVCDECDAVCHPDDPGDGSPLPHTEECAWHEWWKDTDTAPRDDAQEESP